METTLEYIIDRSTFIPKLDDYAQYNGEIYKITQLMDMHEVIGINIKTSFAERLLIKNLKAVKAKKVVDKPLIHADISEISDSDWKEIERRYEVITPILNGATRKEIEKYSKEIGVHYTTLYRWLKGYRSTGTMTGLLPKKDGRKAGEVRIEPRAESILQEMIHKHYLTKQRPSPQYVIDMVKIECKKQNITPPSNGTIRNRINKITEYDRLKRQGNKNVARTKFDPAPQHFTARHPLETVQIDHTPVDIIIVDDETRNSIGRPWITLAIDIYSRMIVGYYLSLDAPSTTSVALCVSNSILPKDDMLLKFDIDSNWDVWGMMGTIHTDNGADFRSDSLRRACQIHGINLEFRPVKSANFGGHIERLIGTLMSEVHDLPGTTFSNIRERMSYDSDGHACFTFDDLEKWIVTFITKIYHKRIHSSLEMSPEQKWKEGIFGNGIEAGVGYPALPNEKETIILDFLPMFNRTIQKNGVNIDGLNYYDNVLRPLINQRDEETKKKRSFIFKRDPRDISYVWFYDDIVQAYYKIPLANQAIPNMNIWQYQAAKKLLREKHKGSISDHQLIAAREELMNQVDTAKKKTKKVRREIQKEKIYTETKQVIPIYKPTTPTYYDDYDEDDIPIFDASIRKV